VFRDVVKEANLDADSEKLYQVFKRLARRKFGWETVPDSYVDSR
jgi:hypothetical protein